MGMLNALYSWLFNWQYALVPYGMFTEIRRVKVIGEHTYALGAIGPLVRLERNSVCLDLNGDVRLSYGKELKWTPLTPGLVTWNKGEGSDESN